MKLCIVWDSILSLEKASKGDTSQIVEMTTALAQHGIDVSLVALNAGNMKIDGASIHQVPRLWYIHQRTRTLGRIFPRLYGYDSLFNARYIAKFVTTVLDPVEQYDLYHVRTRHLAIELKRLQPDKSLVFTAMPEFYHTQSAKDALIDQETLDVADEVITLTEGWKQYTMDAFDLRGKEISVVPVCVRSSSNAAKTDSSLDFLFEGRQVIGYFGRLQKSYGIDTLLEAVPEVKKVVDNLSVIIAGGSVYNHGDELKALARQLAVEESVHFVGEIPRYLVPEYLKKCDVLVSLRYDEIAHRTGFDLSIPIKCVEYIMHGKPVVATRDGGMEQLLGEDYPYLIEHGNKAKIVKSLVTLLTDEKEAVRIGKENRRISSTYTYETVTKQLINVYNRVIEK